MKIVFNEQTNQYESVEEAPASPQTAEMEQSVSGSLSRFANFDVMGVPVGAAAIGGLGAILIDRVVLERVDPTHKYSPYTLLIASAVIGKFGRKYAGDAAKYMALILAYEGVADYVSALVDKVWPKAAAAQVHAAQARAATVAQVGSPAGDYYAQAFRRN